ncbi:hypothetical protein [Amycolatopsis sp. NPDC004378]
MAILPDCTRLHLRLPWLPVAEATVVRLAGHSLVKVVCWAITAA